MRDWLFRLVLLGTVAAVGFWAWRLFFPTPEHIIRKELSELAVAASISPNEGALTKLAKTQKLASFFCTNAQIAVDVPGRSIQTLTSREDIQQAAMSARMMLSSLKVQFVDIIVSIGADRQSAVVHLTATANLPGEKLPEVQELKIGFKSSNHDWLIDRLETVKTLR
jgi:hypothetical protein